MLFADIPSDYGDRTFVCGWPDRADTAADIAARAQRFARRLEAIDPAYGRIGHDRRGKTLRPDNGPPVVDMSPHDLAEEIDRRDRFDPPKFPSPVSPAGYDVMFGNEAKKSCPSDLGVMIRVGVYGSCGYENYLTAWPHQHHSLWQDVDRGIQFLEAIVEPWDATWGAAYRLLQIEPGVMRLRPWLAWTAEPLQPRPSPLRPYPAPFPLDQAGPAAEIRSWRGGELSIWP